MKILVIGYYYSRNLGDAVICDCVAERLRHNLPDAEVVVEDIWGRTSFPAGKVTDINAAQKRYKFLRRIGTISKYTPFDLEWKRQQRVIAGCREGMERVAAIDADVVVFAGGQLFMDWFSIGLSWYVQRFAARKIPVIMNACGVGPEYSRHIRAVFSDALMNPYVTWISSRDQSDHVTSRYLHGGKQCESVTDPALWADEVYHMDTMSHLDTSLQDFGANSLLHRTGESNTNAKDITATAFSTHNEAASSPTPYIGLGMILPYNLSYDTLASFWKGIIHYLDSKNIPWKVMLNGGDADVLFARKVLAEMGMSETEIEQHMQPVPERPEDLVHNIANLRGLISFRLHSHIIATSLNVPTVAIVWDRKVRAFFETIGHPERCFTLKDTPDTIWHAFEKAEQEGYNKERINMLRESSEEKLLNAINAAQHR